MKKQAKPNPRKRLNAAEAIYAWAAWLTTRPKPIILSAKHDAAPVAQLIGEFVKLNDLPVVRDNYPNLYAIPQGLDDVATAEPPQASVCRSWSPHEVVQAINDLLATQSDQNQNQIVAKVLHRLKYHRTERLNYAQKSKLDVSQSESSAYDCLSEFNNIMNGSFTVMT